jgi:dihydrodipicolinate synthase/N-acetylneuraminate lyase
MKISDIPESILARFREGCVIPALPLALKPNGSFDVRSQGAILRYYMEAGVGGVAVGVHSTQFAIRDIPGFFERILGFASGKLDEWSKGGGQPVMKIAGICGAMEQALIEAELAVGAGYHAGLLSLTALTGKPESVLLDHVAAVARVVPVVGFYLQTAVGGQPLSYDFWREFASIDNVLGVKIAPFDRYATLDVVRGVAESGRGDDVTLYTGNDDNIVLDLLTPYRLTDGNGTIRTVRIVGGLLGHWGVWTSAAVQLFGDMRRLASGGAAITPDILTLAQEVTDMNAAVFDSANNFAGCISGIHEVLHRQGLMSSPRCLDPDERLSPGQAEELDRVCKAYPHLTDDSFVAGNLEAWMK